MKKKSAALFASLVFNTALSAPGSAQDDPAGPILITNVNVFDGINEALIEDANVVIDGNLISEVSTEDLAVAGARVITPT